LLGMIVHDDDGPGDIAVGIANRPGTDRDVEEQSGAGQSLRLDTMKDLAAFEVDAAQLLYFLDPAGRCERVFLTERLFREPAQQS
jgi:hypothetical protein